MALQEVVNRRQLLQGFGRGALGLTGAALLGCEGENPEKLFQKLLSTPMKDGDLPNGIFYKGTSAVNPDTTSKALKAIGQINIAIGDKANPVLPGQGISYIVFQDNKGPKQAMENARAMFKNPIPAGSGLPSSAMLFDVESLFGTLQLCAVDMDNVLVAASHLRFDISVQLAQSGVTHLKKVK